jgi:hypothetical protein
MRREEMGRREDRTLVKALSPMETFDEVYLPHPLAMIIPCDVMRGMI